METAGMKDTCQNHINQTVFIPHRSPNNDIQLFVMWLNPGCDSRFNLQGLVSKHDWVATSNRADIVLLAHQRRTPLLKANANLLHPSAGPTCPLCMAEIAEMPKRRRPPATYFW